MTDAEIINLLECCSKSTCSDCGYSKECDGYSSVNFALDLINRLKAENEYYSHNIKVMTTDIRNLQKANDRLKAERDREHDCCNHYMRMCAKAEITNHKHHKEKHCFLNHTLLHIVIHLLFHLVLHGVLEHIIH